MGSRTSLIGLAAGRRWFHLPPHQNLLQRTHIRAESLWTFPRRMESRRRIPKLMGWVYRLVSCPAPTDVLFQGVGSFNIPQDDELILQYD